jgi:alpha-L-rhamnosidase
MPAGEATRVLEGERPANESKGVEFLGREDGYAVLRVGSGQYTFTATDLK